MTVEQSQDEMPLVAALAAASCRPDSPFYAPGHKRGQGMAKPLVELLGDRVFRADLPELPELDNLFAPEGAIAQAQALAAAAFGAEQTWFLANGSTCGIEAAVLATCQPGDGLILPRNAHQSAIAALILSGAVPIFVEPEYDATWAIAHSMTPARVAAALSAYPQAKAVMMVYPTYYGACGDVAAIAHLTHQAGIPLIVDEAHAAHFAFHPDLPITALAAGADIVIQSTHKLLGAMTQASMLHGQGDRVDWQRLRRSLQLVQSTSPSYLLLASLDAARWQMANQGKELMHRTLALAAIARTHLGQIPNLQVFAPTTPTPGCITTDPTRLTVDVRGLGITGFAADAILHNQLNVTAELPSLHTLTFILSLGNTELDIQSLIQGFATLSHLPSASTPSLPSPPPPPPPPPLTPRQAFFLPSEMVRFEEAGDRLSADLICPYPPGIPVLIPGEQITVEALLYLREVLKAGGIVTGATDPDLQRLRVLKP